jgi:hypothetical protein
MRPHVRIWRKRTLHRHRNRSGRVRWLRAPARAGSRFATNSPTKKLMPVALPPGRAETGDQTQLDRVFGDTEDDRRCRRFGRRGCSGEGGRGNHGHATADEVGHERRQAIELALKPVKSARPFEGIICTTSEVESPNKRSSGRKSD